MYKLLILIVCLGFWERASGQRGSGTRLTESECRIALVIGNSNYNGRTIAPLTNPSNDADSIKSVLTRLKFEVLIRKDVSKAQLWDVLEQFKTQISQSKNQGKRVVALLYYAGHGVRWQNDEQLISIETSSFSDTNAYVGLSPLFTLLDEAHADFKIIILDACRERVYGSSRGNQYIPTSPIRPPDSKPAKGQFRAFSTGINQWADDGRATNSPYTAALLKEMQRPNIPIAQTFENIKNQLAGVQQTAHYDEMIGKFCFNPTENPNPTVPPLTNRTSFQDHSNTVRCVSFTKDERYLITGGWDHRLVCYNLQDKTQRFDIANGPYDDKVTSVTISPDDRYFATTSTDSTTKLYQVSDGSLVHTWAEHQGNMMTAQFSPNGVYLAAAGNDSKVYVYRMDNFELEHLFEDHTDAIHQIRFSLDGQFFATASLDRTVHLYKMSDFSSVHTFSDHSDGVNAVSFSPNGRYLATGGRDKQVHLYRMSDKRLLHTFQQHTETIYSICFSADSKLIASAGEDKKVYLYNSDTRRHTQTLSENTDWIYQLCFSSRGRYLATASKDRTLRLYQRW